MRKATSWLIAICLVVITGCGITQANNTGTRLHHQNLTADTVLQGYPCARGDAWFYPDGKLENCTVSQQTQYGEALVPRGSIVYLKHDGSRWVVQLARNSRVHDVLCDGGGFLGPAEGSQAAFYPSGKLQQCWLAGDQTVRGVPCMTAGFIGLFGDGAHRNGGARFYESGKLKSCTLSRDYASQHRGDLFTQAP